VTCTHKDSCALYKHLSTDFSLKVWQKFFCDGKYEQCARFQLALEGKAIPLTLLPNGKQLTIPELKAAAPELVAAANAPATPQAATPPAARAAPAPAAAAPGANKSSYYLRMQVAPRNGIEEEIGRILTSQAVGVDALIRKSAGAAPTVIVITGQVARDDLNRAIRQLEASTAVNGMVKRILLESLPTAN
jgi:hypothetical protein